MPRKNFMISIIWSVDDLEASRQRLLLPTEASQQRLPYTEWAIIPKALQTLVSRHMCSRHPTPLINFTPLPHPHDFIPHLQQADPVIKYRRP